MSTPSQKHFSSLVIEDQIQQTHQQQPNWLLTYVDVFILIIMLVITLIAISDFEAEIDQQAKKTLTEQQQKTPVSRQTSTPEKKSVKTISTEMSLQNTVVAPPTPAIQLTEVVEKQKKTVLPSPVSKPIIQVEEQQAITEKTLPPEEKKLPIETAANKNDLQNQLTETIAELGLINSVNMTVTQGYAQLEIQDKILFKSSEATLLDAGKGLLEKLTRLLKQSTGLIYIEGHTDDRPIKTKKFPSNWELGAARATSVLHFLTSQKLDSSRLRAITYGATKPIADNATKEGRERNRRVSLVVKVSDKVD